MLENVENNSVTYIVLMNKEFCIKVSIWNNSIQCKMSPWQWNVYCNCIVMYSTCFGNIASADRKLLVQTGLLGMHTVGGVIAVEI